MLFLLSLPFCAASWRTCVSRSPVGPDGLSWYGAVVLDGCMKAGSTKKITLTMSLGEVPSYATTIPTFCEANQ